MVRPTLSLLGGGGVGRRVPARRTDDAHIESCLRGALVVESDMLMMAKATKRIWKPAAFLAFTKSSLQPVSEKQLIFGILCWVT